jgi:hypothetical protein
VPCKRPIAAVSSEKTWFYVSDREAVAREVESMGK